MKKILFSVVVPAVLLFSACENTEYASFLQTKSMDNVTGVLLSPNSPVLTADGVAELKFVVKAYMNVENKRTVELIVNGESEVRDSVFAATALVKADRLQAKDVVILSSRGETVENFIYRTDTGAGTEIEFTCTVGGMTSAPCKVKLIGKPVQYTKEIVVPVVFHILSTESNATACNAITSEVVGKHLDRANNVFGARQYPEAPVTVDSKISFVLATHDPDGYLLEEPGIERDDIETVTFGHKDYLWDPDRYLNIFVFYEHGSIASGPQSILSSAGGLPGFPDIKVVDDSSEGFYGYYDYDWGIMMDPNDFIKLGQAGNSDRFEMYLGLHYGLLSTAYASHLSHNYVNGHIDYCSDTYTYLPNASIEKQTYVPPGSGESAIYYNSFNIIDYTSTSSAITPDQVARMRFVIENCPGRMAGWK